RAMHHIEGGDPIACVAPYHRAVFGVGYGELPDRRVQVGNPHAHHPVFAVAFGEGFTEDGVQRRDLAHAHALRRLRHPRVSPVAHERHYACAPAPLSTDSSLPRSRGRGSRSKKLRCRSTRSAISESPTIELPVSAS